jgi:hypothetical protein
VPGPGVAPGTEPGLADVLQEGSLFFLLAALGVDLRDLSLASSPLCFGYF